MENMTIFREKINFIKLKHINYPNLVRISVPPDGSCYFHSILRCFSKTYITSTDRFNIVKRFRYLLSTLLENYYSGLSNGMLIEFNDYTLNNLKNELDSNNSVDNVYQEFISNLLNIDIFIINLTREQICATGTDLNLINKNRNTIVLGYIEPMVQNAVGHYEVIGITDGIQIYTYFNFNHSFIRYIKNKYIELVK